NPVVGFLSVSLVSAALACTSKDAPRSGGVSATTAPSTTAAAATERVKRGEQLVMMGGCNDCHTPMKLDPKVGMPVPDRSRLLSGHPEGAPDPTANPGKGDQAVIGSTFTSFHAPFGIIYAANLTPDVETGLGGWTVNQFVRAVRTGKHRGEAAGR